MLFFLFPESVRARREGGLALFLLPFMLSQLHTWEDVMDDTIPEHEMSRPQESQKTHSGWLDYIERETEEVCACACAWSCACAKYKSLGAFKEKES